jgi:hypothetical protein
LGAGPGQDVNPVGTQTQQPRFLPNVCSYNSWTPTTIDPTVNISIAQRPGGGATLVTVPQAGGSLYGFNLDPRMDMIGDGQKVLSGVYTDNSISWVNGRPVTTSISDGAVYVNLYDENLQYPQLTSKFAGTHIAEPAFYSAQGNIVLPVANDTGLWMYRFDDSMEPLDVKQFQATAPAKSLAVAQLGTAMISSWSTDASCYLHVNTTYEAGVTASVDSPCVNQRIAVNDKNGDSAMLFDSPKGVRMMINHLTMMGGDAPIIRPDATSPRTVFDGTNFWISYLDARGDIVVGFLDANNHPVTMALGAPKPDRLGYELAMIDGSPWVLSVDSGGYNAYRMCVDTVWQ